MLYRIYGVALLVLTPFLWSLWEPANWRSGWFLVLTIIGCVMPLMGAAFVLSGERFYVAAKRYIPPFE
ncbi:hypothetical protein [Aromatoleum evansii]|uniref:hypothetical protein n=1 Tax=Aromatoleum evansii TaxID=59406 RepID=UPI00145EDD86|nr:hypothetical protein [Aromatoleum evansii]NMG29580.1 hypothetical protein [Aromatoleum evansii]